jgi:AraC-like DNA-binding protein
MTSQKLIPVTLIAALTLLCTTWLLFHHREYRIFPVSGNALYYSYTDSADQGRSHGNAWQEKDKIIFAYQLDSGFAYPYVGLGFDLAVQDSVPGPRRYLNLDGFDSLRIRLRSLRSDELRLQLITHDPAITRPDNYLSQRYLVQSMAVERGWTTKSLWIGDFSIPEWWFQTNHLKPDPGNRCLNRVAHLDLQNSSAMRIGIQDTVEIAELVFVGENRWLGWLLAGIALLLLAAFGILNWLERERLRSEREAQIAIRRSDALENAEKIPMSSHRTEDVKRILEYIGKHYPDPELDLERVCRETGVNRNRLSTILKEEVGATFKGHLTDLRLAEATRALAETDLQVTEIAYKVGFGNVSHFNRVFKEHFGITPVEFRKGHKKSSTSPIPDA